MPSREEHPKPGSGTRPEPKPAWLRRRLPPPGRNLSVRENIRHLKLHTVCQEARCPNQAECFGQGTATFLLFGPDCTRNCTFCAVGKHAPAPADPQEPARVAQAVAGMNLSYCVLTMVTRDDLPDGGAGLLGLTMDLVRAKSPDTKIELLISDLGGDDEALDAVMARRPEVLNHNIETVARLYPRVRPMAGYRRSLKLLGRAAGHHPRLITKSGLMLGLGEAKGEVLATLDDLREAGCILLSIGQYLAPSSGHHPVMRYVPPEEFREYEEEALKRGFAAVASAPFVRSSYKAGELYEAARSALGDASLHGGPSQGV